MSTVTGPKIAVVDSISDGATYGDVGRAFLRMFQALIQAALALLISLGLKLDSTHVGAMLAFRSATFVLDSNPSNSDSESSVK